MSDRRFTDKPALGRKGRIHDFDPGRGTTPSKFKVLAVGGRA